MAWLHHERGRGVIIRLAIIVVLVLTGLIAYEAFVVDLVRDEYCPPDPKECG